jgi:hypothetical protein
VERLLPCMYIGSIDEVTTIGATRLGGSLRSRMCGRHTTDSAPRAGESRAANLGIYSALAAVFSGK